LRGQLTPMSALGGGCDGGSRGAPA
jgi:hypothetical protein